LTVVVVNSNKIRMNYFYRQKKLNFVVKKKKADYIDY
jgi:hypothetical protein